MDQKEIGEALKPLSEETNFFYELGKFICAFAQVETAMQGVLKRLAGVYDPRAIAIFGGETIGRVLEVMQRLVPLSALNEEQTKEMKLLISQVHAISSFRNALIHRPATITENGFVSFKINKTKTFQTFERLKFQLEDLRNATEDLDCIEKRASIVFVPPDMKAFEDEHLQRLFAPWQYKPLEPEKPLSAHQP